VDARNRVPSFPLNGPRCFCGFVWRLVNDHSYCSRLSPAHTQRLGLHFLSLPIMSHSDTLYPVIVTIIGGLPIQLSLHAIYHAILARLKVLSLTQPTERSQSVLILELGLLDLPERHGASGSPHNFHVLQAKSDLSHPWRLRIS